MRVELLRAWPARHEAVVVELPEGACVDDALRMAGWRLDAEFVGLAVFGVAADGRTRLHPSDRVELWRPLQRDPKQARRLRAERAKARGARD